MMKSEMDEVGMSLNVAIQLADVASDWGLDEIEIDGEMQQVYDIYERLCAARDLVNVVLAYLDTLPAAPAPDWSEAPDWAMWWAVDADDNVAWFQNQPFCVGSGWFNPGGMTQTHNSMLPYHLPIGVDWRETLVARPTEDK